MIFKLIKGKHIDMSGVHRKFESYFGILLSSLYEDLQATTDEVEATWKRNLRALAKTFLCRAGYKPCIDEAQMEFKKWMDIENPEDGNP
jgi:hypothetical protein